MVLPALACLAASLAFGESTVKPKLTVQSGHGGPIESVALTPDGSMAVTGARDGSARLWDLSTGREIRAFPADLAARTLAISGGRLIIGSVWSGVNVWDIETGALIRTLPGKVSIDAMALSEDGGLLATAENDSFGPYLIHLWDLKTGAKLRTMKGHKESIRAMAMIAGSRLATSGNDKTVRIWDLASGRETAVLKDIEYGLAGLAASPDGGILAGVGIDGVMLWDVAGKPLLIGKYKTRQSRVSDMLSMMQSFGMAGQASGDREDAAETADIGYPARVAFTPDGGALILGGDKGGVGVWSLEEKAFKAVFQAHEKDVSALAFDGKTLITGSEDPTPKVWDMETGKEKISLKGKISAIADSALSPDDAILALGDEDGGISLWDLKEGAQTRRFQAHDRKIEKLAVSNGGKRLLTSGAKDASARLWDGTTGEALAELGGHSEVKAVALSADGRLAATVSPGRVALWEASTGKLLKEFKEEAKAFNFGLAFSPDGRKLLYDDQRIGWVWDIAAGRELHRVKKKPWCLTTQITSRHYIAGAGISENGECGDSALIDLDDPKRSRAFKGTPRFASADGKGMIVIPRKGAFELWDLETDRREAWAGDSEELWPRFLTQDMKIAFSYEGTVASIWDARTGRMLVRLYSMKDGWAAVSPEGYFDGSPGGLKSMRWTAGLQTYPLESFSEGYYVPGLLARVVSGQAIASSKLPMLSEGFSLPPSVAILSPESGSTSAAEAVEVQIKAVDEGGGIGEIRLYHNGKAVGTQTRGMKAVKQRTQTFNVTLADGANVLRAVALSRDRIEGNPAEITVTYAAPKAARSRLHLLAVGLNAYKNPGLNLNYAKPDAQGLLAFFAGAPRGLFNEPLAVSLYDAAATKAGILASLGALESSAPDDVVLIYMAGHGDSVGADWYFIPHELVYPEKEGEIAAKAISAAELQKAMSKIGARKVVLLLDSCKSGSALSSFAVRGFEDRKALAQLARAAGVHVVAAASKDQFAAEVKELGHGVFTYTLLQALGGKADGSPKDGIVTIRELLSYVESELPELSQKYQAQAQYPTVRSDGMDFPITTVKAR